MAICPLTSFYYSARCLSQNASTDTTTFLKLLYYLYEIHSTHISANSIHPYLHLPDNGHACRIREVYGARTHRRQTVARACHRRKRIGAGAAGVGAATDTTGVFVISGVTPGICRLYVTCIGYKSVLSAEYFVSAKMPTIEIELDEDSKHLNEVTVSVPVIRRVKPSPVSMQIIGLGEIEKSPGGNRDISRIVRSVPGVSFSPIGYRNDLIVRGGSPSENRFFMDGIEIPNINHFATQGASGGPVSILNADLIREVQFYTGAFPADRGGALSSVMDISLLDGNTDENSFKATLGASEVSLSGMGHFGSNTTYLFSVRQSYLQLLFKMIGLPFLPNYIDGQFKIKTKLGKKDEITFLGLTGIDNMKLNTDQEGEDAEYMLSYLPRITQQTFTLGASYKHYAGKNVTTVSLGYNYLGNQNLKYRNNDNSAPENLTLDLSSREQKLSLRAENRTYNDRWTWREGVEAWYAFYNDHTYQKRLSITKLKYRNTQPTSALQDGQLTARRAIRVKTEDLRPTWAYASTDALILT